MPSRKKFVSDKEFNIRKMVKMVNTHTELMNEYLELYGKYKSKIGYHYNEYILIYLFIHKIETNKKYEREYDTIKVVDTDATKVLSEDENMMDETTTSASSGSYSTPKAWSSDGKPHGKPTTKGGTFVKMKESNDINKLKTPSIRDAEKIGKMNQMNMKDDFLKNASFKDAFKSGSYADYLKIENDSLEWDELVARRNTKEEDEKIKNERGGGMQHIEPDFPNEEWEERRDADLGDEMAEDAEEVRKHRKEAKEEGYPKVTVPVKEIKESIDNFGKSFAEYMEEVGSKRLFRKLNDRDNGKEW